MKHSNFDAILEAIKNQEMAEFRDAIQSHGGEYYFLSKEEILSQQRGEAVDDEHCPHVYATHGSNIDRSHELVVHYVTSDTDDNIIRVMGREYYDGTCSYCCEWQIEQGSWFDLMDAMDDPSEDK